MFFDNRHQQPTGLNVYGRIVHRGTSKERSLVDESDTIQTKKSPPLVNQGKKKR